MRLDHNHTLFLGASDTLGAVQIEIQLADMENHTLWSRAMKLPLLKKNKVGLKGG